MTKPLRLSDSSRIPYERMNEAEASSRPISGYIRGPNGEWIAQREDEVASASTGHPAPQHISGCVAAIACVDDRVLIESLSVCPATLVCVGAGERSVVILCSVNVSEFIFVSEV